MIDMTQPNDLSTAACDWYFSAVFTQVSVAVIAASSSYAVYQSSRTGKKLFALYQRALRVQTKPFSPDVAKQYVSAHSSHKPGTLDDYISLCSNIPRLLHLVCTAYDPKLAVQCEIDAEYTQVFESMADFNDIVDWESELKLMLAAAQQLPITVYDVPPHVAANLFMVKAFLLYLDNDSVPRCFLQIPDGAFRNLTRKLWRKAPVEIRTSNKATIGDFFERSLPNAILHKCPGLPRTVYVVLKMSCCT